MPVELELVNPAGWDLKLPQNDSLLFPVKFGFSLTGSTIEFLVRRLPGEESSIVISKSITTFSTTTVADDTVTISLTKQEVELLENGYHYTLAVLIGSDVRNTYLKGRFLVIS